MVAAATRSMLRPGACRTRCGRLVVHPRHTTTNAKCRVRLIVGCGRLSIANRDGLLAPNSQNHWNHTSCWRHALPHGHRPRFGLDLPARKRACRAAAPLSAHSRDRGPGAGSKFDPCDPWNAWFVVSIHLGTGASPRRIRVPPSVSARARHICWSSSLRLRSTSFGFGIPTSTRVRSSAPAACTRSAGVRPLRPEALHRPERGVLAARLAQDALAGVIVGIVTLPRAIAFGIATGVTPGLTTIPSLWCNPT